MTEKDLKGNVKKTKAFCTGERTEVTETSKFPCSVCGKGVKKSIFCITFYWKCIKDALAYDRAYPKQ